MKPEEAIEILKGIGNGTACLMPGMPARGEDALKMAISALEKRIPKKPVEGYVFSDEWREHLKKHGILFWDRKGSCCPSCGNHVGESELTLKKKNYHAYCKWCGQALEQPGGEDGS